MKNSSRIPTIHTLARGNPGRSKRFLEQWLNLYDVVPTVIQNISVRRVSVVEGKLEERTGSPDPVMRELLLKDSQLGPWTKLCREFPEFMPDHVPKYPRDNVIANIQLLRFYQEQLAQAWKQPTTIMRQTMLLQPLYAILKTLYEPIEQDESAKPEGQIQYEQRLHNLAMLFSYALTNLADRMRFCANPDCLAPYFIAKRPSQRYCSDICSIPGQRAFKRAWWAAHGRQWRQERKKIAAKMKGKSRKARGKA